MLTVITYTYILVIIEDFIILIADNHILHLYHTQTLVTLYI